MKVVLASGWYFPDTAGGTEVYVDSLARELSALGVEPVVMAPSTRPQAYEYQHRGVRVVRYSVPEPRNAFEARGISPPPNHAQFETLLKQERAQIYHQHAWSRGLGIHHLVSARALGLKTLMTVHTPGLICRRGTLLELGRAPCDGHIQATRCARCFLQKRGLPERLADALAHTPLGLSAWARDAAWLGRASSVLGAAAESASQLRALGQAAQHCEQVVVVCAWLRDALARNGVPDSKMRLCRQGLSVDAPAVPSQPPEGNLKVGFLGRWDSVKGLDVLVGALLALPAKLDWACEIRAPSPQDSEGLEYRQAVLAAINGDPRFTLKEDRPRAELSDFFASIHLLAVPSQWFETGPLVVLEAHAHGVPVIGTRLGGIAELVSEGVSGWLTDFNCTDQLIERLTKLCASPPPRLSAAQIVQVRTQAQVASEMVELYGC